MRTSEDGANKSIIFEDMTDLLAVVNAPCAVPDANRSSLTGTAKFTGTADMAEALDLARKGWAGGTAEIQKFKAHIETLLEGQIPVPQPVYAVQGQRIHMGRHLAGMPDPFIRIIDTGVTRKSYAPRVLRIVCNISASGAMSQETILRRGAALIVLVDTLERRRIRCQIDLAAGFSDRLNGGDVYEIRTTVKQAGEYLSVDKLAYLTGHASSLRRLMFAVGEHEPDTVRKHFGLGRDMGSPLPADVTDRGDIYLGRMMSPTDWGESVTTAWLKKTLKEQGIVLTTEGTV